MYCWYWQGNDLSAELATLHGQATVLAALVAISPKLLLGYPARLGFTMFTKLAVAYLSLKICNVPIILHLLSYTESKGNSKPRIINLDTKIVYNKE